MNKIIMGIFFKIIYCRRKIGERIDKKKTDCGWVDSSMGIHFTIPFSSEHLQIFIIKTTVKS